MISTTISPIVASLLWLLCFLTASSIAAYRGTDTKEVKVKRSNFYAYYFLLLTFCVLIGTSSSVMHFFKCHEFVLPGGENSEMYLYKDYSIDCNSNRYQKMVPFAITMIIIYPIGIPLLYFVLLWEHRRVLSNEEKMKEEAEDHFPTTGHILFLVEAYKYECYWFELLECVRRLLLAAIIGIVSEDAAAAPVMGILVSLAFVVVFTNLKPYKEKNISTLGIILSCCKLPQNFSKKKKLHEFYFCLFSNQKFPICDQPCSSFTSQPSWSRRM